MVYWFPEISCENRGDTALELNKKTIRNILLMAAAVIAVWWLVNHFDLLLRILRAFSASSPPS